MRGGGPGKALGVVAILSEHWEAVEADLCSEYGVDLLDLYTDRLTLRRVAVLVGQLQAGSRLRQLLGGPDAWSPTVTAVHDAGYLVRGAIHGMIQAQTGKKPRDPQRVEPPAPGWVEREREKAERQTRKYRNWKARNGGVRPRAR